MYICFTSFSVFLDPSKCKFMETKSTYFAAICDGFFFLYEKSTSKAPKDVFAIAGL